MQLYFTSQVSSAKSTLNSKLMQWNHVKHVKFNTTDKRISGHESGDKCPAWMELGRMMP